MKPKPKLLPLSRLTRPFLMKFFADPKKKWCVEEMEDGTGARCAYGHVYHACFGTVAPQPVQYREADQKMAAAFDLGVFQVVDLNNGKLPTFKQRTPRARILAALRAAGRKGG